MLVLTDILVPVSYTHLDVYKRQVQGVFAWLVFPFLGALLAVPADNSLFEIYANNPCLLYTSDIMAGGILELEMGNTPNFSWGIN